MHDFWHDVAVILYGGLAVSNDWVTGLRAALGAAIWLPPAEAEIPIEQRGDEEVKYAEARKPARLLDGSEWDVPYPTRLSVSFWHYR